MSWTTILEGSMTIEWSVFALLTAIIGAQQWVIRSLVAEGHVIAQRNRDRDDKLVRDLHGSLLRAKDRPQAANSIESDTRPTFTPRPQMPASLARDVGLPGFPKNGNGSG